MGKQEETKDEDDIKKVPTKSIYKCCPRRWCVAFLILLGGFVSLRLASSKGVIVGVMLNKTRNSQNTNVIGEYHWQPHLSGYIDSSFCVGFVMSQMPGGFLTIFLSSHLILGISMFGFSTLNLVIPLLFHYSAQLIEVTRFFQGIAAGPIVPAMFQVLRWWSPPLERTIFGSCIISGFLFGIVLDGFITSVVINYFSWNSTYYFNASFGFFWCYLWWMFAAERPAKLSSISDNELQFIEKSLCYLIEVGPRFSLDQLFQVHGTKAYFY